MTAATARLTAVARLLAPLAVVRPSNWLNTLHMLTGVVAFCIECNGKLDGLGKVECNGCRTSYIIRKVVDTLSDVVFYAGENDFLVLEPVKSVRTYLPRLSSDSIEFESNVEDINKVEDTTSNVISALSCVICHKSMIGCLSVRVSKPVFVDYEERVSTPIIPASHVNPFPVMSPVQTVIKSRPSSKIGRAHSDCAMREEAKPFSFRMVDLRTTPDKRQKSIGNRENDRLLDKWVPLDTSESIDFE